MKSTKKSLLMSTLSLMLCIAMLLGTTFAWFTDSVTSGKNTIQAGNLDIELYHTNKVDTDEKVTGTTALFDGVTLWEPGAACYENFTVKNIGTLKAEYRFSIEGIEYNSLNGKDLRDVIKVAVVDGGFTGDRTAAAALTNYVTLAEFERYGELEPTTGSDTYGIVLYWAPGANDNDYNANNGAATSNGQPLDISFVIKVLATQAVAENDSFDNRYDELAPIDAKTYEIGSVEDFNNVLAKTQDGDTIVVAVPNLELTVAFEDAKTITLKGEKIEKLTATAPNGTINVYNDVTTVVGTVVDLSNSAHLYGKVNTLDATKGHFVVEAVAEVENINTTEAAVAETLKIDVLGKVNTLTTEKGVVIVNPTAEVKTLNAAGASVKVEGNVEQLNVSKGTVKVEEAATVKEIETPATEVTEAINLEIAGKVDTLDVQKVSDNIVVKVTGNVEKLEVPEGEKGLQVKVTDEGKIGNAEEVKESVVEPFEAKIGETTYPDLQTAVNAAQSGDIIKLTKDATPALSATGYWGDEYHVVSMCGLENVTVDFNGHRINGIVTVGTYAYGYVQEGSKSGYNMQWKTGDPCTGLVFTDTSTNGNGGVSSGDSYGAINVKLGSDLTINGGCYYQTYNGSASGSSGYAPIVCIDGAKLTVNNGTFENRAQKGSYNSIFKLDNEYSAAAEGYVGCDVTVKDGTFKTTGSYGYVFTGTSMSSCKKADNIVIDGGKFETGSYGYLATGVFGTVTVNNCDFTTAGSNVFSFSYYNTADHTVTVNGGNYTIKTYMSTWKIPLGSFAGSYPTDTAPVGKVILKGGTINSYICDGSKIDGKTSVDLVADGYHVVDNGDGTKSVVADN